MRRITEEVFEAALVSCFPENVTVASFIVVLYAPYPQGCHNRVQRLQVCHKIIIITTVLLARERAIGGRGGGEGRRGKEMIVLSHPRSA